MIDRYGRSIIEKLKNDNIFSEEEKAYIEKSVLTTDYYIELLDEALGLTPNNEWLIFNVEKE